VTDEAARVTGRWWRSHSVRMRLTMWYVAAMMVVLGVYVFGVYTFVSQSVSESLDERLRADYYWAAATVDEGPDGLIMPFPQIDLLLEEESPWVQVWSADGTALLLSNEEARRRPIPESQTLAGMGEDMIVSIPTSGVPIRLLSRRSYIVDRPVTIQVARSEAAMQQELRELSLILIFGLPVGVVIAGLGGYTLARRALAPIEQMTERARTITAERLSDRLPVTHPEDEMGRLASVFNETLSRLEGSFAQMRHFTTDVSHELRTPLTAIRSVGEVGLRGHRTETSYRGIIGSMLEEVDRLSQLVDRLLALSRAGTPHVFSLDAVDLASLAEDVVSHLGVLAEEKGQTLSIEKGGSPWARADRVVLRQALINLVDNAIKFTPSAGRVRLRLSETPSLAVIDVIDTGPGVPSVARDHIFDRFYRIDGNETFGTGLGLSLARGGVEAIGGRLTLEQSTSEGSTFRITVPKSRGSGPRSAPGSSSDSESRNPSPDSRILTNRSDSLQTTGKGRTA
jgi:heavy metal sensor kinase